MQKIYKYELSTGKQEIWMPKGAHVFSVIEQNGKIVAYAIVDIDAEEVIHKFNVLGTGWNADDVGVAEANPYFFIGTVKTGVYVWHVFYDLTSGM